MIPGWRRGTRFARAATSAATVALVAPVLDDAQKGQVAYPLARPERRPFDDVVHRERWQA